jgi:hypothetical protein
MNGKGDRSTQEASCRIERLTRRLTLADPAAPRNETETSACVGIVAPQSPPCRPAGPWDACGQQSRGIARNEIGRHPGEAWTPCGSTAYRDFAWISPIPFQCASASALRRRGAKAVSQLPGFRIYAAPLPLPPAFVHRRIQGPRTTVGGLRRYTLSFVAVCFLPPCL